MGTGRASFSRIWAETRLAETKTWAKLIVWVGDVAAALERSPRERNGNTSRSLLERKRSPGNRSERATSFAADAGVLVGNRGTASGERGDLRGVRAAAGVEGEDKGDGGADESAGGDGRLWPLTRRR